MISRPISGVMENLNNFDSELCNSINICLYITSLLYCDIIHKPIVYMYYTWDKLFEAPGFKSTLQQNKLVLIWKYVYFIDIIELGDTYSWSTKIQPIHSYPIECWQSLLTFKSEVSVDEALLLWKGWLTWKQYIRTKQAHFDTKTFVLVESSLE